MEETWLRSHVERFLQDIWKVHRVAVDGDGDFPYRWGSAACWVSLASCCEPVTVDVIARAASGVPRSGKLLREINEVNRASRLTTVFWSKGSIIVKASLPGSAVDRDTLGHLTRTVAETADHIGPMITSVYGGATPFAPVADPADGTAE